MNKPATLFDALVLFIGLSILILLSTYSILHAIEISIPKVITNTK